MQQNTPSSESIIRRHEFTIFSLIIFLAKSFLLIRMPYRGVELNAIYTSVILLFFYLYLRFRQDIQVPIILLFFLAGAVGADVAGNYFQLYGKQFGPVMFDEFTHFLGPALSLPPTFWGLRETLKRTDVRLPDSLLSFFSMAITFGFAAYYEVLELWDEKLFGGKRLWTPTDSANDLQFGLLGIAISTTLTLTVFKLMTKRKEKTEPMLAVS
jgi:hypothetical protein